MVKEVEGTTVPNLGQGAQIQIDLVAAEKIAKQFDKQGQDLMINVDYDFGAETPVNFVTIDPMLFGTSAFVEVVDVATLDENSVYETVDGFEASQFDKTLTSEANKQISPDLAAKTLAPSQFAYGGLGVFAFPLRLTSKLRVTLLMRDPVPNVYERLYVLLQETVVKDTTVSTTKKSGIFGL